MAINWIKIEVKYNGRCEACTAWISVGSIAYWKKKTKNSKARIRHASCHGTTNVSKLSKELKKIAASYNNPIKILTDNSLPLDHVQFFPPEKEKPLDRFENLLIQKDFNETESS